MYCQLYNRATLCSRITNIWFWTSCVLAPMRVKMLGLPFVRHIRGIRSDRRRQLQLLRG